MTTPLSMTMIDLATASEAEYAALAAFESEIRLERLPDDPPIPAEEMIGRWRNIPDFVRVLVWAIWDAEGSAIVASATVQMLMMDTNRHLADLMIAVAPAYRRQGLARRLLEPACAAIKAGERSLVMGMSTGRVPAGAAFLERLGATRGMDSHMNQLDLAELNRDLLRRWLDVDPATAADFELGFWGGPYPEEDLAAVVDLYEVMNEQPQDDLDMEAVHFTAEQIREMEAVDLDGGKERLTLYLRDRASGRMAGFTEVSLVPSQAHLARQGFTGVFPEYRNRGLGRWLKAAMLDRILRERPEVRVVRTGNADSNAPMLRLNNALGFKPYLSQAVWQVPATALEAYLAQAPAAR